MTRHQGTVLVDTNVILECHRTRSWNALANGYSVETVEDCVAETQPSSQMRLHKVKVDEQTLRASLEAVHNVENLELIELSLDVPDIHLDQGEAALLAHAKKRKDDWVLCGPDKASLRFGVRLGLRHRLISLERLLSDVGHRLRRALRPAYTRKWYLQKINELALAESK